MTRIRLRPDLARKHRPHNLHQPGPQAPATQPMPGPQPPPGRRALWTRVGLPLAACIVVAALVLQSSYGGGAKLVVARWAPQLVSTPPSPPENLPSPAQPAPSTVQVAAAEISTSAAPPQRHRKPQPWLRPRRKTPRRQHPQRSRSNPVAANDRARSRESGAQHRTAPGRTSNRWPATMQRPSGSSRRARTR